MKYLVVPIVIFLVSLGVSSFTGCSSTKNSPQSQIQQLWQNDLETQASEEAKLILESVTREIPNAQIQIFDIIASKDMRVAIVKYLVSNDGKSVAEVYLVLGRSSNDWAVLQMFVRSGDDSPPPPASKENEDKLQL